MADNSDPLDVTRALNCEQISALFGVSLNTVRAWIRDGMPVVQKGDNSRPYKIDLFEVIQWREDALVERGEKNNPLNRKLGIEADRLQIKLDRERALSVDINDAHDTIVVVFRSVADALNGMGRRLQRRFAMTPAMTDEFEKALRVCRQQLADDCREKLRELATEKEETT